MNIVEEVNITAKTILLIDNEFSVREVVGLCLQDLAGWNVVVADSPLTGLQKVALAFPDAIVLDLSMCDLNNFEFMQILRNNPETQSIPVILLSAKARWLDSYILREYQIAGVIRKPFDPVKLPVQIAMLLGWNLKSESDY
ncbi:MAG: response regulator [Nostoc sp. TH1S01]|nr:response regulator [Nostoc sp. TH1S01]